MWQKKKFNIQGFYLQEKDMLEGPILKCLQVYQEKIYRIKKEIKYKLHKNHWNLWYKMDKLYGLYRKSKPEITEEEEQNLFNKQ